MATEVTFEQYFSEQDIDWLNNLWRRWEDTYQPFTDDEELAGICANMAGRLLDDDPEGVEQILEYNDRALARYRGEPTFCKLAVMGLEYGVACENGPCANFLGAMHVIGRLVDKDLRRAVELFKLGERQGVVQSAVNLGYSYEYGWLGEPDYLMAYMQYAKAASFGEHPEALYKMGDMYARAKVVRRDLRVAYFLYEKSFTKAQDNLEIRAQPAFRMAQLMEDKANEEWDIPYDPLQALGLYQLAERGLYLAIANGATYYRPRLQEAIEGQERIRALIASGEVEL